MKECNLTREDDLNLIDMQIIEESVFIDESGALTFAPMPLLNTSFLDQTFPMDQFELQPQTIFQIQKTNDDSTIYFVLPEDISFIHNDDIVDDSVIFTTPLNQRIGNEDNPDVTTTLTTNTEDEITNDVVNQSLLNDSNIVTTGIENQILDDESRESFINGLSMVSKLTGDDIRDLENIDIIDDSSIFSKLLDDDISDIGNETMIDIASMYDPTVKDQTIINIGKEASVDMATLYCATVHDENMKDLDNCTIIASPTIYKCHEGNPVNINSSSGKIEEHSISNQTISDYSTQLKCINSVDKWPVIPISTKTINGDINDICSQSVLNQPTIYVKKIINLSNRATVFAKTCENLTDAKQQNMIDPPATYNHQTRSQVIHDISNRLISEPPPLALIGSPRIYQAIVGDRNLCDNGTMIKTGGSTVFTTMLNHNTKIGNRGKKMSNIEDWKIGVAKYAKIEEDDITSDKDNVKHQRTTVRDKKITETHDADIRSFNVNMSIVEDQIIRDKQNMGYPAIIDVPKISQTIDRDSKAINNTDGPTIYTVDDEIMINEEKEVMVDDSTIFHITPDSAMDEEVNRIIIGYEDSISSNESIKDSPNVYRPMENQITLDSNKIDINDKSIIDTTNDQDIAEHYSRDDSIDNDNESIEEDIISDQQPKEIINIALSDDPFNDENSSWSVDSLNPTSPDPQQSTLTKQHLYRCDYKKCKESFVSLYEKKIHLDSHIFRESTEFRCGICNAVFDRAVDRNKHVEAHAIPPTYKCKGCKTDFTYFTVLMRHLKEKRCSSKNPFTCYFCETKITDYEDLIKHHQLNMKQCLCGAKKCGMQVFQLHSSICARTLPESPLHFEKKRFKKGKT